MSHMATRQLERLHLAPRPCRSPRRRAGGTTTGWTPVAFLIAAAPPLIWRRISARLLFGAGSCARASGSATRCPSSLTRRASAGLRLDPSPEHEERRLHALAQRARRVSCRSGRDTGRRRRSERPACLPTAAEERRTIIGVPRLRTLDETLMRDTSPLVTSATPRWPVAMTVGPRVPSPRFSVSICDRLGCRNRLSVTSAPTALTIGPRCEAAGRQSPARRCA